MFRSSALFSGIVPYAYEYLDKHTTNIKNSILTANQKIVTDTENPRKKPWIEFVGGDNRTYVIIKLPSPCKHIIVEPVRIEAKDLFFKMLKAVVNKENWIDIRVPIDYGEEMTYSACRNCKFSRSCDVASKRRYFILRVIYKDEDLIAAVKIFFNKDFKNISKEILEIGMDAVIEDGTIKDYAMNVDQILDTIKKAQREVKSSKKLSERTEQLEHIFDQDSSVREPSMEELVQFLVVKNLYEQGAVYPQYNSMFCSKCGRLKLFGEVHCPKCGNKNEVK